MQSSGALATFKCSVAVVGRQGEYNRTYPSLQEDWLDSTALHSHTSKEPSITKHIPKYKRTNLLLAINTSIILRPHCNSMHHIRSSC